MPVSYTLLVYKGGFEGPENGPKQRKISNRALMFFLFDRAIRVLFCLIPEPQCGSLRRLRPVRTPASTLWLFALNLGILLPILLGYRRAPVIPRFIGNV